MSDTSALPPLNERPAANDRTAAPSPNLPIRFVWQSDDLGCISGVSDELMAALGDVRIAGHNWDQLIVEHGLDPSGELAQALARRETWSGVTVSWPLGDGFVQPVELAGLPVFDRDRTFRGYRGFGVVREAPVPRPPEPEAIPAEAPSEPDAAPGEEGSAPILPFRRPGLNSDEHLAFREIARALNARTANDDETAPAPAPAAEESPFTPASGDDVIEALEELPAAILIHRLGVPLFANHAFLDLTGFEDLPALVQHGLDNLFEDLPQSSGRRGLAIRTAGGRALEVEAHLKKVRWQNEPASMMFLGTSAAGANVGTGPATSFSAVPARDLRAMLDSASDGVILLDNAARIVSVNKSAELLFGYESAELEGRAFTLLLGADSHRTALDHLDALKAGGSPLTIPGDGREAVGVTRRGGIMALHVTFGRLEGGGEPRFCAVVRDITAFRKTEHDLRTAKARAEHASAQKSDFLARISHEIRTPLSAILGFTEVMMEERFGPVGSDRYRQYLEDIHQSGNHIISLVNDLLDLAKIEAGKLDLNFVRVNLNEVATAAANLLQPQANSNRIIIRTALTPRMPPVLADARSMKQIVLNLVANAVRYTPAGGQVIVSTALNDLGQAALRVRDTGPGMSDKEIATALEPFRQLPTANSDGGTGLGLPLSKALAEANKASFNIASAACAGTLVEIVFAPDRVLPV